MANHKSALKRAGQNETRRMRNKTVKTRVKHVVKEVRQAAAAKSVETVDASLRTAQLGQAGNFQGSEKRRSAQTHRRQKSCPPGQAVPNHQILIPDLKAKHPARERPSALLAMLSSPEYPGPPNVFKMSP